MRFLITDDHPLFREALRDILRGAHPDAEIREARSIASACAALEAMADVDLVLLDLSMEDTSGFDGLLMLRKRFAALPILVVSGRDEPRIVAEVRRLGAAGFVSKAAGKATLAEAVAAVLRGDLAFPYAAPAPAEARSTTAKQDLSTRIEQLTPQQLRVLSMIRQGKLNKQIAHELNVGDSTVKAHVSAILRKLGVVSRTQIVIETAGLSFNAS